MGVEEWVCCVAGVVHVQDTQVCVCGGGSVGMVCLPGPSSTANCSICLTVHDAVHSWARQLGGQLAAVV